VRFALPIALVAGLAALVIAREIVRQRRIARQERELLKSRLSKETT